MTQNTGHQNPSGHLNLWILAKGFLTLEKSEPKKWEFVELAESKGRCARLQDNSAFPYKNIPGFLNPLYQDLFQTNSIMKNLIEVSPAMCKLLKVWIICWSAC